MTIYNVANNASTALAADLTAGATSLTVEDGFAFPADNFLVSIDDEIIKVGSRSGDTFSGLSRAQEGTAAAAHDKGVKVENRFTAGTYMGLAGEIGDIVSDIGDISSALDLINGGAI